MIEASSNADKKKQFFFCLFREISKKHGIISIISLFKILKPLYGFRIFMNLIFIHLFSVLSGHGRYVDEVEVVFNTDILFNDKLFSLIYLHLFL